MALSPHKQSTITNLLPTFVKNDNITDRNQLTTHLKDNYLYTKHKYSTKPQNTDSQHDDLPPCPLCNLPPTFVKTDNINALNQFTTHLNDNYLCTSSSSTHSIVSNTDHPHTNTSSLTNNKCLMAISSEPRTPTYPSTNKHGPPAILTTPKTSSTCAVCGRLGCGGCD